MTLRPYPLSYDGTWYAEPKAFREATPGARAIVAVAPNNPTGSWLEGGDRALFAASNIPLIEDEVFAAYPLRGEPPASSLAHPRLHIRLGGLSKYGGLPQLKLAWMILDGPELEVAEARERLEISLDAFLSLSAPATAHIDGLLRVAAARRERIGARLAANYETLTNALKGSAITPLLPQAGWYVILRLPSLRGATDASAPPHELSEEDEAVRALADQQVLAQPGWLYEIPGGPHLVISLLSPPRDFRAGVEAIRARY